MKYNVTLQVIRAATGRPATILATHVEAASAEAAKANAVVDALRTGCSTAQAIAARLADAPTSDTWSIA
jgi:hypothetical protein